MISLSFFVSLRITSYDGNFRHPVIILPKQNTPRWTIFGVDIFISVIALLVAYFIRFGAHRLIVFCSMNYIEREVAGLQPSVALIPAAKARLEIHDYTGRLLRALGNPPVVIATHWDVQSWPYGAPQDAAYEQAQTFVQEVRRFAPDTRVVVPRHFDTVVL